MSEVEKKVEVSFEPGNCKILGVMQDHLHILADIFNDTTEELNDCVLIIPKEEYLRVLNIWISGKQDYCERYNEYCGVMGYVSSKESAKYLGIINIYKWNEEAGEMLPVPLPSYSVDKFQDYCDFEHG